MITCFAFNGAALHPALGENDSVDEHAKCG
jgi:hypothetical protein